MCGIAGIISVDKNDVTTSRLKAMTDRLAHRGPDGEGHWINTDGIVGLGHRRLSIIDISDAAKQPMHFMGRYTIVFNGAIYNYIELREKCIGKGYRFFSQSDTEVIMAMYDWKKEECLQHFDGMFAFALYDAEEKKVFIARDRFGEKPFYYYYHPGRSFLFASEMKGLWAAGVERKINNRMLYNYMAFNYTYNCDDLTETFFQSIFRLPPAHFAKLDLANLQLDTKRYWDVDYNTINPGVSIENAREKFRQLFYTSVTRRLRSDVAVGSSLSGGIDSSIVVSVINDLNNSQNLKQSTFSAVFPGFEKDETGFIKQILDKINADAHFTSPDENNFLEDIDECFYYQEEPFGSASVLAQYEVMKLAKKNNVTVLLDGQGADELLAGYHHFFNAYFSELKANNKRNYQEEKRAYAEMFRDDKINPLPSKSLRHFFRNQSGRDNMKKWNEKYQQLLNPYFNSDFFHTYRKEQFRMPGLPATLNEGLYNSMKFGLQELLRFADRNSMANGRELRLPFLNHEVVEFLFTLPSSFKIHNGWTKYLERITFEDLLPRSITWRKDKIGYEPPQKKWMEDKAVKNKVLTARKRLVEEKILHPAVLKKTIEGNPANVGTKNSWNQLITSFLLFGYEA
ncbi:MAG: asparagine synthase (glutamine-hydrolyzing) [Sphingobacteriales bacterium]|nr:asparagine synthase (glutamine-hydrolyzing) [Sphingobacteriales bacterium]